ncbi:hypothetical protein F4804DRAFT_144287 [Jackrogersella minutella]|nr:hypothetical protein F4804DRAFT_144287 [Jackrogersella minutella]
MGTADLVVLLGRHGFMVLAQDQFYLIVVFGNGANGVAALASTGSILVSADTRPPCSFYFSLGYLCISVQMISCDGWILARGLSVCLSVRPCSSMPNSPLWSDLHFAQTTNLLHNTRIAHW